MGAFSCWSEGRTIAPENLVRPPAGKGLGRAWAVRCPDAPVALGQWVSQLGQGGMVAS